jgi:putative sporulation protein YtaF
MNWTSIILLSLANNLDNTGVGIAYGFARIRITVLVNLWISVITFVLTGSAVLLGSGIGNFVPPMVAKVLGATVLCGIGVYVATSSMRKPRETGDSGGNVLQRVLEDPKRADQDRSSHIDYREGTLLGFALSINNIGGGIGGGLVHLSAIWTAVLSAIFSFVVLWAGGLIGCRVSSGRLAAYATVLAGVLLVAVGIHQLQ